MDFGANLGLAVPILSDNNTIKNGVISVSFVLGRIHQDVSETDSFIVKPQMFMKALVLLLIWL
jgi:hypothetical protein